MRLVNRSFCISTFLLIAFNVCSFAGDIDTLFKDYLSYIEKDSLPELKQVHKDFNRIRNEQLSSEQAEELWQLFYTMEDELTTPFVAPERDLQGGRRGPAKPTGLVKEESKLAPKIYAFNRLFMLLKAEDVRPLKTAFDYPGSTESKEKFFAYRDMEIKRAKKYAYLKKKGKKVKLPAKKKKVSRSKKKKVAKHPVLIDTTQTRWHSTQTYANPGQVITVEVPEGVAKLGLKVRIGASGCNNFFWAENWIRWPLITREVKIEKSVTQIANVFGGMVYIIVPNDAEPGKKIKALVSGGVKSPYFQLGKTSPKRWDKYERKLPAPWAEMANGSIVMTVQSLVVRDIEDPTEIMKYWQKVADLQDELSTREKPRYKERFSIDRQICVGYMHAGYPIMAPEGECQYNLFNLKKLKEDGHWGWFHELGHNHQRRAWVSPWTNMGEVTVNFFSMYCTEKMCDKEPDAVGWIKGKVAKLKSDYSSATYVTKGVVEDTISKETKGQYFGAALSMFMHLRKEFGWNLFREVFRRYEKVGQENWPKTEQGRADLWTKMTSEVSRRNLVPFYEAWGYKISDETVREIKKMRLKPYLATAWPEKTCPPDKEVALVRKKKKRR